MSSEELFNQFDWRVTLDTAPLPDGRMKKSVRVHRCDAVNILTLDADNKVLLLKEFRAFFGEYIYMLPGGKIDKEKDALIAAQRELQEETGYKANILEHYCDFMHSEAIDIMHHAFIAKDLEYSPLPQDSDELITVESLTISEAIDKVLTSPHIHAPSGFLLMKYARENGL